MAKAARTAKPGAGATPAVGRDEVKALDAATAKILRLKETISVSFYELGIELARVQKTKLYRARGHARFEHYLVNEARISKAMGFKLVKIVKRFTAKQAKELGFERLQAAASLMDATPADEDPKAVARLPIPTAEKGKKGRPKKKPLALASVEEVEAAARAARAKARAGNGTDRRARPVEGDRFAAAAELELRGAGLSSVRVKARKAGDAASPSRKGYVVDLLGLEPELAVRAIELLAGAAKTPRAAKARPSAVSRKPA